MKKILTGLCLYLCTLFTHAQTANSNEYNSSGTSFHFSFIQNRLNDNGTVGSFYTHPVTGVRYEGLNPGLGPVVCKVYISNNTNTNALASINFNGEPVSYATTATVISTTGNLSKITIPANSSVIIQVTHASNMSRVQPSGIGIQNRMFTVTSINNQELSVYAESSQGLGRDASLILSDNALGNSYIVSSYDPDVVVLTNTSGGQFINGGPGEIAIVALEATTVKVTLPNNVSSVTSRFSNFFDFTNQTIVLQAGEVYQIQSDNHDLSGTLIESMDKKDFAVFAGNMATTIRDNKNNGGNWDHLYEQMLPIRSLGCNYIAVPLTYRGNAQDVLRITATVDNTEITINNDLVNTISLNAGDFEELVFDNNISGTNDAVTISADQSISVAQYAVSRTNRDDPNFYHDPMMMMLSPLDQGITEARYVTPSQITSNNNSKEDFTYIVANTNDYQYLEFDGNLIPKIDWTETYLGSGIYYTTVQHNNSSTNSVIHTITSTTGTHKFNAYTYGFDFVESYGYAVGVNTTPVIAAVPESVCKNESVQLKAFGGEQESDYTWSPATGLSCTKCSSPIAVIENDITYTVDVNIPGSCNKSGSVSMNVKIIECTTCDATILSSEYTNILSNLTYSANTIWRDKVYIADNVIVTVDAAILDITNVDVVFGECAGINFVNGAKIRANNSVFRPCDENQKWRGLEFQNSGVAQEQKIIECTFKGATSAIRLFHSSGTEIMNNSFYNNSNAIFISGATVSNEVTIGSNSFTKTFDFTTANNCFDVADGYIVTDAMPQALINITNNDFTNNTNTKIKGIKVLNGAHSEISGNSFSNLEAIDQNGGNTVISNNTLFNTAKNNLDIPIPIIVINPDNAQINNNTITIDVDDNLINNNRMAIIVAFGNSVSVENNTISNFPIGIAFFGVANSIIKQNTVKNSKFTGIITTNGTNVIIACNTMNSQNYTGTLTEGVGITINNTTDTRIYGNCISNVTNAIYLTSPSNYTIPEIRNNVFFNYTFHGVYNNGYTGSIGTAAVPGQNTFWSNRAATSGVFDIFSTNNISAANNFGVNVLNNVSITQNLQFHATAACSPIITNSPHQGLFDPSLNCNISVADLVPAPVAPSETRELSDYSFTPEYEDATNTTVLNNNSIEFYPNPVGSSLSGKIQSFNAQSKLSIEVYNVQGNLLYKAKTDLVGGTFELDVNDLEKGLYILKAQGNDLDYTGKFVKE